MDYKRKYLKYKTKYLHLSKIQSGGTIEYVNYEIPFEGGKIFLNTETNNKILVLIYRSSGNTNIPQQFNTARLDLLQNERPNVLKYIDITTINDINGTINKYFSKLRRHPTDNYYILDLGLNEFDFLENLIIKNNRNILLFNSLPFNITDTHKKDMIYNIFEGYKYYIYNEQLPIKITIKNIIIQYDNQNLNVKIIPFDINSTIDIGQPLDLKAEPIFAPEEIRSIIVHEQRGVLINEKICVYFLGKIFHYILSNGQRVYSMIGMFQLMSQMESPNAVLEYNNFEVSPELQQFKDLTMQMLQKNPDNRPTLDDISNALFRLKQPLIKPARITTRQDDNDDRE